MTLPKKSSGEPRYNHLDALGGIVIKAFVPPSKPTPSKSSTSGAPKAPKTSSKHP